MKLKSFLINLILSSFSIYVPLLFFSFVDNTSRTKPKININFIENLKIQKISALNQGFKPVFYPAKLLKLKQTPKIYPIGTIPNTKSYLCDEGYGLVTYQADRFGLRNLDSKWDNITNNNNVFAVGDSFTNGACVSANKMITSNIESKTNLNTINLSIGGNGPYEYMALSESIISPVINLSRGENRVVLIFYDNDNVPYNKKKEKLLKSTSSILNISSKEQIKPSVDYLNSISDFLGKNYPKDPEEFIKKLNRPKKINFKKTNFYIILSLYPIRQRLNLVNFTSLNRELLSPSERAIVTLSEICQYPCKPFVAYIPSSNYWDPYPLYKRYKKELQKISKQLGMVFIDGQEVIDKNNKKNYAPQGPHLSIEGYKKIADLISRKIIE